MSFKLSSIVCDDDFGDTTTVKDVFLNKKYGFFSSEELCRFYFWPFGEVVYGNNNVLSGLRDETVLLAFSALLN